LNPFNRYQTTLKSPFTVTGRGYWSGLVNTLTFFPAPADTGIRFHRQDLVDREGTVAIAENVQGLPLRTCLGVEPRRFQMVEHVLAALVGMRVDNAEVWCTAEEMPGMDGSSYAYASAIAQAGVVSLPCLRPRLKVEQPVRVGDSGQWLMIEPAEHFTVEYRLDYGPASPIKAGVFSSELDPSSFADHIAPARTFVTQSDAEAMQSQGVARHVTERDLLVFGDHGPIGNRLRFSDECARHKALDIIGDLAVVGVDLVGKVTGCRSGHVHNAQLSQILRRLAVQQALANSTSNKQQVA
jgi:UDP-3-O-[3-hydroxymyristoyl] N-acetylglucosamine deacetylase